MLLLLLVDLGKNGSVLLQHGLNGVGCGITCLAVLASCLRGLNQLGSKLVPQSLGLCLLLLPLGNLGLCCLHVCFVLLVRVNVVTDLLFVLLLSLLLIPKGMVEVGFLRFNSLQVLT